MFQQFLGVHFHTGIEHGEKYTQVGKKAEAFRRVYNVEDRRAQDKTGN